MGGMIGISAMELKKGKMFMKPRKETFYLRYNSLVKCVLFQE
jgi:hypothetical protein